MKTGKSKYVGYEIEKGVPLIVLRSEIGDLLSKGKIKILNELFPDGIVPALHVSPTDIVEVRFDEASQVGRLNTSELPPKRKKVCEAAEKVKSNKVAWAVKGGTIVVSSVAGFFFPPAWKVTAGAVVVILGKAGFAFGVPPLMKRVKYIKFNCLSEADLNRAALGAPIAVEFDGKMPERDFKKLLKFIEGGVLQNQCVRESMRGFGFFKQKVAEGCSRLQRIGAIQKTRLQPKLSALTN